MLGSQLWTLHKSFLQPCRYSMWFHQHDMLCKLLEVWEFCRRWINGWAKKILSPCCSWEDSICWSSLQVPDASDTWQLQRIHICMFLQPFFCWLFNLCMVPKLYPLTCRVPCAPCKLTWPKRDWIEPKCPVDSKFLNWRKFHPERKGAAKPNREIIRFSTGPLKVETDRVQFSRSTCDFYLRPRSHKSPSLFGRCGGKGRSDGWFFLLLGVSLISIFLLRWCEMSGNAWERHGGPCKNERQKKSSCDEAHVLNCERTILAILTPEFSCWIIGIDHVLASILHAFFFERGRHEKM